jgi:hypothetical protein
MKFKKIFIGCVPRSGSTLLARHFTCYEHALITPESPFKKDLINYEKSLITKKNLIKKLYSCRKFRSWNINLSNINLSKYANKNIEQFIEAYALNINKNFKQIVWVDHTPENLLHIHEFTKHYKFDGVIHLIRDPRAVVSSLLNVNWAYNDIYNLSYYYRDISLRNSFNYNDYSGKKFSIRFEDFALDHEVLHTLIKEKFPFLIRAFSRPLGIEIPSFSKKQHSKVNDTIDLDSLYLWKKNLKPSDINQIIQTNYSFINKHYNLESDYRFEEFSLKKAAFRRFF